MTAAEYVPTAPLHHASASKTDVLFACQYWASPSIQLPTEISDSPYARFGSAFHKTMEVHLLEQAPDFYLIGQEFSLTINDVERLKNYYERGSGIIDKILTTNGWAALPRMVETKLAYDPFVDKARVLESKGQRDYSARKPTELPGTGDLIIPNVEAWQSPTGKALVVFDWKSGQSVYDAKKNLQLSSLGLMAAKLLNQSYVHVAILRLDDEFAEISEATRSATQLEHHRTELKKALRGALAESPSLTPGTYCQYCPALEICPVHRDPYYPVEMLETAVSTEQMAHIFPLLQAAEKKLHKARERVKRYVEMNGPLDLDSGKRARIVDFEEENISKASIKRALGNVEGELLIEDLRAKGVIEKKLQHELRVVNTPGK